MIYINIMISQKMRQFLASIWEFLQVILVAAIIVIPIRMYVFQPFIVNGASMEPNYYSGDYLIIDELTYRFDQPQRGDVIVFKYPKDTRQRFIKRIIGLPGEKVEVKNGNIHITSAGKTYQLDEKGYLPQEKIFTNGSVETKLANNEYFVMGDNRFASYDSRAWGPLPQDFIVGKMLIKPFSPKAILDVIR